MGVHVCHACGVPQPLRPGEDLFASFGLEQRFAIDSGLLERRFYEISRLLHPDRFAAIGGDARRNSTERMTFLNDGYRILKNAEKRREWLLNQLAPAASPSSAPRPPQDLASAWFDLQDDANEAALKDFETRLQITQNQAHERIRTLERELDALLETGSKPGPELLAKMKAELLSGSYLSSLERDVERLKKRLFIT
ncbi:MAG: hypothetical protein A2X94_05060 [Bdellovibrionales bacterium GWB1_55_8]|nr:MAG: hypothetical protein A2X94_05060 [Bdellovibrionales bacterium GWB1_55_8]